MGMFSISQLAYAQIIMKPGNSCKSVLCMIVARVCVCVLAFVCVQVCVSVRVHVCAGWRVYVCNCKNFTGQWECFQYLN